MRTSSRSSRPLVPARAARRGHPRRGAGRTSPATCDRRLREPHPAVVRCAPALAPARWSRRCTATPRRARGRSRAARALRRARPLGPSSRGRRRERRRRPASSAARSRPRRQRCRSTPALRPLRAPRRAARARGPAAWLSPARPSASAAIRRSSGSPFSAMSTRRWRTERIGTRAASAITSECSGAVGSSSAHMTYSRTSNQHVRLERQPRQRVEDGEPRRRRVVAERVDQRPRLRAPDAAGSRAAAHTTLLPPSPHSTAVPET